MKRFALAAALVVTTMSTSAMAAVETFASFDPISSTRNIRFVQDQNGFGGSLITLGPGLQGSVANPGVAKTTFNFLQSAFNGIGNVNADFSLSAITHDQATNSASGITFEQPGFDGSFKFVYSGASDLVVAGITYHTGALLLQGVFENALLGGVNGGTSGSVIDSTQGSFGGAITYTSDFLSFQNNVNRDFSFSLTSVSPVFTNTAGDLASFRAVSTGSFSSDPLPTVNSATPEASTWAMLLIGFGAIGGTVRSRSRTKKQPAFA